jgi:hypothetical protein
MSKFLCRDINRCLQSVSLLVDQPPSLEYSRHFLTYVYWVCYQPVQYQSFNHRPKVVVPSSVSIRSGFMGLPIDSGPGSSVWLLQLATCWTVRESNPSRGEIFRTCPNRPWGPPSLLYNGYRVFPEGKERPGRDADSSLPSSAVGHERVELYLYSPYGPYGLYRATLPVQ